MLLNIVGNPYKCVKKRPEGLILRQDGILDGCK